ncbi:Sphingosine-1-phosphate lyase [Amphibalanus amphitrite]|uniref:sphinganine-1-phosphate aldolase n=1 Tax=Amphibalanus amphitrite TaxID=1232801 RepID=A0A6A4WZM1_AMPAM|nr:Sphingosine-1-phosphate lyase [Amphibalanus amphitrite]
MEAVRATCDLARCRLNELLADREPWQVAAGAAGATLAITWIWAQVHFSDEDISSRFKKRLFRLVRTIPAVRRKIEKETRHMQDNMNAEIVRMNAGMPFLRRLPDRGISAEQVLAEARRYCALGKFSYKEGCLSGTVYNGSADLTELMTQVYGLAAWSNPLHPDVFPGVRKMEAEIIRMCCQLFSGGPDSCGTVTSGGTESIIMAMKSCRDMAREERGITRPEVLVPFTAHAAFDKGAQLLRMKLIHIPVDPETSRVNVSKMKSYINSNTVMLVCSAPAFPHGNIDPIEEVGALGIKYGIPVHVDSCLGGFLVPFMKEAGFPVVPFDFSVPGVTSISADTHKYGFAPKGTSVILYSSQHMRHFQYFVQPDWPGGIYASPSMAGSRAGAVLAACWAALMYYGRQGYVETTRRIIETARFIEAECRQIPGIRIQGSPDVSVVAFASDQFNIYRLSDAMAQRGWNFNALQNPPCFHIAVTYCQTAVGVRERLVKDMRELTAEMLRAPADNANSGDVALYGMAASVPDRSLVSELAWCFVDSLYTTEEPAEADKPAPAEADKRAPAAGTQ